MKTTLDTGDCLSKSPLFPEVIGPSHVTLERGVRDELAEDGKRSRSNSKM